jgi:hypothetical protein
MTRPGVLKSITQPLLIGLLAWLAIGRMAAAARADEGTTSTATARITRHPISIIEADVYVNRFKTTMRLRCFADDLELLQTIEPDDTGHYDVEELRQATRDHAEFLAERIQVLDRDGHAFPVKIVEVVDMDLPPEGIDSGQLMNYSLGFVFEYAYDEPPEFLTFQQNVVDENFVFPSELKMLVKQAGSETPYGLSMRPGEPQTIAFDWDRPPLSQEASEQEWEEWFDAQREKNLGITSYSSLYSFIYITDYEVRVETLIPLASLATMVELEHADDAFLAIDEQDAAAERIKEEFRTGNPVKINDRVVEPRIDRIDFYGLDLRDFAMQAERRPVSLANGRVGIIASYPTNGTPHTVSITWDKFNNAMPNVDAIIFAFEKTDKAQFSRFLSNNTYEWTNPGRPPLPTVAAIDAREFQRPMWEIPVPSTALAAMGVLLGAAAIWGRRLRWILAAMAVVAGITGLATYSLGHVVVPDPLHAAPRVDEAQADELFGTMLANLFRAMDYFRESDIYDALAVSVDGPLLRQLYLEFHQSLVVKEQGGAVSRIDEVNFDDGEVAESSDGPQPAPPGFAYRCRWNVVGTIEHWGHIHQRTNHYQALFTVEPRGDAWKITSMQMEEIEPGQVRTSLRKF